MGHGIGSTKPAGLFPFAKGFVSAEYTARVFDYLFFAESDGTPRNLLSPSPKLQVFRDIVAWVRK
ncbi:hypothetical protein BDV36DRAFT_245325 [Aspergillus pseudocaelatus]|uniref:Uncharacterized protein n=1 Tax=Aspergillus pseudocaelatus TaxID=1825620 RepID=A0ABQ6WZM0_9EURO|nr:hypothetical protein BDV36DRAFT_245325 [Aspergillus pseudocaelatus]